ncbi:hypothetical protein NC99_35570 [Sunxiuqinia dokdonensis]|uniref:Uncharacterized protein n=1 Tax=Sunxiuqinia dokdonensis TaxID=1409788 RepID=A0A0L8V642_9BACT|nr:hypothetical protein NC99_35570 [Sunxiuqinia dokdonensis]
MDAVLSGRQTFSFLCYKIIGIFVEIILRKPKVVLYLHAH